MADTAAALSSWSTTVASNLPIGSTTIGTNLAPNLCTIQSALRYELGTRGTIASATTTDLATVQAGVADVTGTTTITGLGTVSAGMVKVLVFAGILTLTHNATSLKLVTAANITTAAGDAATFISLGAGNWECLAYVRRSGASLALGGFMVDGSAAAPSVAFLNSTTTGFYRQAANSIGFATNGTLRLTLNTAALTSTLPLFLPEGSVAAPSIQCSTVADNSGLYFLSGNTTLQGDGGSASLQVTNQSVTARSSVVGATVMNVLHTGASAPDSIVNVQFYSNTSTLWNAIQITADVDGTPDLIWRVRADGATFADGAYSGAGADFAEAFLHSGEMPQAGDPVVLVGDRVRIATHDDAEHLIVGVVSDKACAIGDSQLLGRGGVPVGLVGKVHVNAGRPTRPSWRTLGGNRYLIGVA